MNLDEVKNDDGRFYILRERKKRGKRVIERRYGKIIVCNYCGEKAFARNDYFRKEKGGLFCSRKCKNKSLKNKIKVRCEICGKEFKVVPYRIKQGWGRFCSFKCRNIWLIKNSRKFGCKNTSIELKMEEELKKREILYEKHETVQAISCVDFLLLNKIIVQCDGDYWHSLADHKKRDKEQDKQYKKLGYKVFRFWGSEIRESIEDCVDKIERYLKDEQSKKRQKVREKVC